LNKLRLVNVTYLRMFIFVIAFFAFPLLAVPSASIISPRPNGWVVDLSGRLKPETVTTINQVAEANYRKRRAEMAVVVIGSTDGIDARQYTVELFNRWGVGNRKRNDGVLILAAIEDRAVEIVVGDGFPADIERRTDLIMKNFIVPSFQVGDIDGALLEGAQEATRTLWEKRTVAERVRDNGYILLILVTFAPALIWILSGVLVRSYFRYRPRKCQKCNAQMKLVNELTDDKLLNKVERLEEKLGSVDYDIWACPVCYATLKNANRAVLTEYTTCMKCKACTLDSDVTTLRRATTYSSGLERVDYKCKHCGHRHTENRKIPRIRRSSSSSSSSGSGSGFGGGSSSGRGSSGRW